MLVFVGLGLYSWEDVSVKGLNHIRRADQLYLETYTSRLMGSSISEMERAFEKSITLLTRYDLEQKPDAFLDAAQTNLVVLLTGGDPMISTTHTDLRLRAAERGIRTRIIHGASIASAACGLCGLQNYRFGKSCSIPYPHPGWFPVTPLETIELNQSLDLHTLVFLDITDERCMTIGEGIILLQKMAEKKGTTLPPLFIGVARAGSPEPRVLAGFPEQLQSADFGPPLHILVIPADLHPMEEEYLQKFARQ
ncbi:MAG: diphthine synthase [Methanomicrobiales archaeon]|nr:diphthine synthase [Methanomicrobiales archaeon]